MPIATLANLEKTFGQRVLFDKLNLNVYRGDRIGLIGANGSGKTSLFKVLAGQLPIDAGSASVGKSIKMGYLTQDPVFDPSNSVMDEAETAFGELHRLSHRLRHLEHEMGERAGDELDRILKQYEHAQHAFDLAGGYAWRHRVEATLQGVGLMPATWEQEVNTLSGGQKSRLALAKVLIAEPDLLLLDEPTNHLDLSAIEWLERYLLDYSGAVVLISHDRFLLDRLATKIAWLRQCAVKTYRGNYTAFVQQRELEELSQSRAFEKQREDIAKQEEFIRRFGAGQRSREAQGRKKRLERFLRSDQLIDQVEAGKSIHLSISTDQRAGDRVLSVAELSKRYDGRVLWDDIRFEVGRGQRIGILGPNGSGKTTLLDVLLGRRDADAGEIKWGANLNIGYYDQKLDDFDPANTILEEIADGRMIPEKQLRDVLATMLFRGDDVHKSMSLLSGGERARVALARLLLDEPNVLLLDEPTNHLDISSREALEGALKNFNGTILCVSHDRYFLDRTVNRLLVLDPPRIVDFDGNYSTYAARMAEAAAANKAVKASKPIPSKTATPAPSKTAPVGSSKTATPAPAKSAPKSAAKPASKPVKRDNPYLRPFGRLSLGEIERSITDTEIALAETQELFANPDTFKDPARAKQLQIDADALAKKLKGLEEEYYQRENAR